MPIIRCYVDDTTLAILQEYGERHGRTVESLAEAAIAEEALRSLPSYMPALAPAPCRHCSGCEGGHQVGCINA